MATKKTTPDTGSDAAAPQPGQEATRPDDAGAALDEPAPQPDPHAKRLYMVTALSIRHDGRTYGVGKDITLTDAQAKRLAGLVVLAPVTSKE